MEPNKVDTYFKSQLDSREIVPSEMAWTKLDTMLSAAEKPKASYNWLFIAASCIGFLLMGTVFLKLQITQSENPKNEIVVKTTTTPEKKAEPSTFIVNKSIQSTHAGLAADKVASNEKTKRKQEHFNNYNNPSQKSEPEVSIINQKSNQKLIEMPTSIATVDEQNIVAVTSLKKEKQLLQNSTVHVNASRLLSQVDEELDLSFRERVITKVSKNYQSVKVALANRNLE